MKSLILILLFLVSCSDNKTQNKNVELFILNKELVSLEYNDTLYWWNENYKNKSKNIIKFKVKNNSSKTYYFNISGNAYVKDLSVNLFNYGKATITNSNKDTIGKGLSFGNFHKEEHDLFKGNIFKNEMLNYNHFDPMISYIKNESNFVLYPNETKYFETYINLPIGDDFDKFSLPIDTKEQYYFGMSIFCDASKNKFKNLIESEIRTIKENKYTFYSGYLVSSNRIPVRVIK